MENRFHELHPLKRFKLLQKQEEKEGILKSSSSSSSSSHLPAKKRKKLLNPSPLKKQSTTTVSVCLPAKKRVWALQPPPLTPEKPIAPFDLNLEYHQSPEKESLDSQKKLCFFSESEGKVDLEVNEEEEKEVVVVAEEEEEEAAAAEEEDEEEEEEEEEDDDGIVCAVCQSTDGDPSDPIVFCDGCDLMVHATCYGNPLIHEIPEGDWFCSRCQASSSPSSSTSDGIEVGGSSCCLCPVKDGALKPTIDGKWAHIVCALLVPEVFFKNPEGREGIDCSLVPDKRWDEICYVCNSSNGCAIECSEPKCSLAFHVSCGLKEDLCIEYREGRTGRKGAIVAGFCKTHTQLWEKQQQTGKFKIVAREEQKK